MTAITPAITAMMAMTTTTCTHVSSPPQIVEIPSGNGAPLALSAGSNSSPSVVAPFVNNAATGTGGNPGDGGNFDRVAEEIAGGYRVVAPDLPGFGASTRSVPDYAARTHAHYALALLDHLGVEITLVVDLPAHAQDLLRAGLDAEFATFAAIRADVDLRHESLLSLQRATLRVRVAHLEYQFTTKSGPVVRCLG